MPEDVTLFSELAALDRSVLAAHPASIVAVDSRLDIRYANPAWFHFAAENGGEPDISQHWGLGVNLMDAIPEPLVGFYRELFDRALRSHAPHSLHPLTHEYECSSPDRFRRFSMAIYPMRDATGLLLVHSLRVEAPIESTQGFFESTRTEDYVASDGLVRQCACCRRIRSVRDRNQWHWIRAWVRECIASVSHTVCPVCATHYYPGI
jgi:hypothetical protein